MKRIFASVLLVTISIAILAQAKRPEIMVVPSDLWCNSRGYIQKFNNAGSSEIVPDYKEALQNNFQLISVITVIGQMMSDRGFPLKNLETELKALNDEEAENNMALSKSGSELAESPIDILYRHAKADIILQVTWEINKIGPKSSVTFNLQGLDSYTHKQIAACHGTGTPSFSTEINVLLEEAVLNYIEDFNSQLQAHFDDIFTNGREVTLNIRRWDDSEFDLESEIEGEELADLIETWVSEHTINGRFNMDMPSENRMYFKQVRIPLIDEKTNRLVDTRNWARGLTKYLASIGVPAKLQSKGLGVATVTIGGK